MSMSISCAGCGLEYAGGRACPAFCRRLARSRRGAICACSPKYEVPPGREAVLSGGDDTLTLQQFLRAGRVQRLLCCALHDASRCCRLVYRSKRGRRLPSPVPVSRSLQNHGMLTVTGAPTWYTVVVGRARYVEKVAKGAHVGPDVTAIQSVRRIGTGVECGVAMEPFTHFAGVVIRDSSAPGASPCSPSRLTPSGGVPVGDRFTPTTPALLHTDTSVLPILRHRAQASWNLRVPACDAGHCASSSATT